MLVLMNSNQYSILVIWNTNQALQQFYSIQKLMSLTKPQKRKGKFSICPYYKGEENKEHWELELEIELAPQRYLGAIPTIW